MSLRPGSPVSARKGRGRRAAPVRRLVDALPLEPSPDPGKETAPANRGQAGAEVYREKSAACRHDPDVDSQSADPIKFCFRKPQSLENWEWRPVLSLLRETVFGY